MSEETSAGKMITGVLAVVAIGIVGYFIYINTRSPASNVPPINMSREELMKGAMVDGPASTDVKKAETNVPQMKSPKKGGSAP